MTDLLSKRIIAAKRELTALKQAHKRGIGNLKIYTKEVALNPSGHETGIWYINVSVNFDSEFAPYPLVNFAAETNNAGESSVEVLGIDYGNNGYTLNARLFWIYEAGLDALYIESTSPISSSSVSWSSA